MRGQRSGMRSRGLDKQLHEQRSGTLTFGELKWLMNCLLLKKC